MATAHSETQLCTLCKASQPVASLRRVSLISERARTVTNAGTNGHESTEFAQHTSKHSMRTAWRNLTETCLHAPEMAALANVAKEVV